MSQGKNSYCCTETQESNGSNEIEIKNGSPGLEVSFQGSKPKMVDVTSTPIPLGWTQSQDHNQLQRLGEWVQLESHIPPLYHREERESVGGQLAISTTHIYLLHICCGRAHQTLHNSFPLERGTTCRVVWEHALRITQELTSFFCRGTGHKRFTLCQLFGLGCNLSTLS